METQLNGAPIEEDGRARCAWALSHPLNLHYHDTEWGMPVHGDQALFERIMLDALIWSHKPTTTPAPRTHAEVPTQTPESRALAKDLRSRGFVFVGPTKG